MNTISVVLVVAAGISIISSSNEDCASVAAKMLTEAKTPRERRMAVLKYVQCSMVVFKKSGFLELRREYKAMLGIFQRINKNMKFW
ncbi:hypothetical protein ScPMuIL_005689 [Solemya velum]